MFDLTMLAVFLTATLALNLSPGPDVFYVLANSARHGTRGGVLSTLGVSAGVVVHTVLAAFGIAALLAVHRWAFEAVRLLGALYLIWLGLSAWRSAGVAAQAQAGVSPWQIVRRGFVTNVLNPKVGLFFLAFLPQFTDPERGSVALQILILGAFFICSGTLVNAGYALAGGWVSVTLRREPRWQRRLDQLSGSILLLLGLRLLLPQRCT
ncbi:MAG TPA: LysE family translocator [Steroidobacteraceae bacterium]